jgi:hypothetical protein
MTSASRGFTANRLMGMLKAMMKNVWCIKPAIQQYKPCA